MRQVRTGVDSLVNLKRDGVEETNAHEAKSGYQAKDSIVAQLRKDDALLSDSTITHYEWHFFAGSTNA